MELPEKNPKVPDWAREPVQRFISNVGQIHDFYHLTRDGLGKIIHHHELIVWGDKRIEQLTAELEAAEAQVSGIAKKKNLSGRIPKEVQERVSSRNEARKKADLALREVSKGFPVLHSQQVVFLWGAVEAVVEDILAAWLGNEKSVHKEQRLRKIRVSLADFSSMNEVERNYHLVSELQRELRPSHRSSIEVFELLLDQFGLRGAVSPEVKRNLMELEHVRNLLLHRRGIADSRFIEACPWMSVEIGAVMIPEEKTVIRYSGAVLDYADLLLERIKRYFASKRTDMDTPSTP